MTEDWKPDGVIGCPYCCLTEIVYSGDANAFICNECKETFQVRRVTLTVIK